MKNGNDPKTQIAIPKGATQTDLRLTRHPADTPRARLHKLASRSIRAVDEVRRSVKLGRDDLLQIRAMARRGLQVVDGRRLSTVGRLVARLCAGVDEAVFALTLVDLGAVAALCEGLTLTLVQLEAAENSIEVLKKEVAAYERDLRTSRGDVAQLRTLLAAAHTEAAKKEATELEKDNWNEKTSKRDLTPTELHAIRGSDMAK